MKLAVVELSLVMTVLACAQPRGYITPLRDPSVITAEEIMASLASDAYEAIVKLRGNFLESRGPTSLSGRDSPLPTIFVDGMEYGPVSSLRLIPASNVAEIRLLRSYEATTLYGTGYMSGVIEVTTRRE